jgi:glucose-1-phosphate thymidylyltransferase
MPKVDEMKGVLLAGGYGSRLRPLTYITNKHLLPVYDKPMIEYGLEALYLAGIKDICVVLGGAKPEDVIKYLGNGYKYGVELSYKWQGEPKGIAHAILCTKDFIKGDSFVVHLADNILVGGMANFVEDFDKSHCDARILLVKSQNPENYGVAEIKGNKLVGLEEKPKKPKSNLIIAGIYCLKPSVFELIEKLKPSWRGELEITDTLNKMVTSEKYKVEYRILEGQWFDCGSFDNILEAGLFIKERMRGR